MSYKSWSRGSQDIAPLGIVLTSNVWLVSNVSCNSLLQAFYSEKKTKSAVVTLDIKALLAKGNTISASNRARDCPHALVTTKPYMGTRGIQEGCWGVSSLTCQ